MKGLAFFLIVPVFFALGGVSPALVRAEEPETKKSNTNYYGLPKKDHTAKLSMGAGVSQLVSEDGVGRASKTQEVNPQMTLLGMVEYRLAPYVGLESGLSLGLQIATMGKTNETAFSARYLSLPLAARMYFTRQFSLAAGMIAVIPTDDLNGRDESTRLVTTDIGVTVSARVGFLVNRYMDWIVEASTDRGLFHVGDAGSYGNHVRYYGVSAGVAAYF